MNKYPNLNTDNPFASQSKMFAHMDNLYEYYCEGDTYPVFMEVNLTSRCNLNCSWCISENFRGTDELNPLSLMSFMSEFKEVGGKALTFSGGGEPTLYPDFERVTKHAKKLELDLGLMTNGVFNLDLLPTIGNNFDWVRISLDTVDYDKYKEWKGVNRVPLVLNNIERLKEYPVKVGVNVNVSNDHRVKDVNGLISWTYEHVDYIQFRPVLPRYFKEEELMINDSVWKYLTDVWSNDPKINLSLDKLNDLRNQNFFPFVYCEGHLFNPILDSNGNVCVCMYHPNDDNFVMGNIYANTLKQIWESEKRAQVRLHLATVDYCTKCQVCCKLTEINKFLDFLKDAQMLEDKNFL